MSDALFRELAPRIMRGLMSEFPWAAEDAAAAVGNAGHESAGFLKLQEIKPVVKGSRGGWGWFQWTGPRRRAFEAWAKARGLAFDSYEANYGFLVHELQTSEKATIAKVSATKGLNAKVKAFELAFERAGVKHYPSRNRWARVAMEAFAGAPAAMPKATKPAPAAPPAGITDKATVEHVQRRLRDLDYAEVGDIDGRIGDLTRGAVRIFRADAGLAEGDQIDAALIVALATAKPRQLAPARAEATPAEVRERVPEVKATWLGKVTGKIGTAVGAGGALLTGIWDQLGEAQDYLRPVRDFVGDVPGWLWFAALAGGAFLLWRRMQAGEAAGVAAFQQGARR